MENKKIVSCDASCGKHALAKGKADTGVYRCATCAYCKDKRHSLNGSYIGTCVKK